VAADARREKDLKRLRRHYRKVISSLDLPQRCDLTILCQRLGSTRGRPIHLTPTAIHVPNLFGLWIDTPEADFIVFESETSKTHQEHIVAHELGHIICHHRSSGRMDDSCSRLLFPDLDPELVRAMLKRSTYSTTEEWEAEVTASWIINRTGQASEADSGELPSAADEVVARIQRSLMPRR